MPADPRVRVGCCIECGRPSPLLVCRRCYDRPPEPSEWAVSYRHNGEAVLEIHTVPRDHPRSPRPLL